VQLPGTSHEGSPRDALRSPKPPNPKKPNTPGHTLPEQGPTAHVQKGTPSQSSPKPDEAEAVEPLSVFFDEFLLQPTVSPRGQDRKPFFGTPLPGRNTSTPYSAWGGLDEAAALLCYPPEFWAATLSLPARSDSSNGGATGFSYAPKEKVVAFVRAVLGQQGSTAYEALPPGTPGLAGTEASPEVQLRGRYESARIRKTRKGEVTGAPKTGDSLGVLEGETGGVSSEKQRSEGRAGRGKEGGEMERTVGGREGEESTGIALVGKNDLGRGSSEGVQIQSVVATEMAMLKREARALLLGSGLSGGGRDGLETGADASANPGDRWTDSKQAGGGASLGLEQKGFEGMGLVETSSIGQQPIRSGKRWKLGPVSPLLLQQAITGLHKDPVRFRIGASEQQPNSRLDATLAPVSAATVAEVLASDILEALQIAYGKESVSGPLSVDHLCRESGKGLGQGVSAMQVGSPAIEHPVTPPQLWVATLKPPGGGGSGGRFAPRLENPDAVEGEGASSDVGTFKALAAPLFLVGYQEDWLRIPQGVLRLWEKAPLEPYAARKPVVYYAFCPAVPDLVSLCGRFLREVGSLYEACQLGSHVAASLPSDLAVQNAPGIVSVAPEAALVGQEARGGSRDLELGWFVEGIRTIAGRLQLAGANKGDGREGSEEPCMVRYHMTHNPWEFIVELKGCLD
jgi:hypothetical protein